MDVTFRLAREDEDDVLARILYNAFLDNWDVNWWQNLRKPLRPVSSTSQPTSDLSWAEKARLDFYHAVVNMTRLMGGTVAVAQPKGEDIPAAVLCWLPPRTPPTTWAILRSGLLWAALRFGPIGAYNFISFERSLDRLFAPVLSPMGYHQKNDGAFVQIVATTPSHSGKGLSASLMKWQIERHRAVWPDVPVFLDTANEYSVRVYERVGFRELARHELKISEGSIMDRHWKLDHIQVAMMLDAKDSTIER